MPTYHYQCRLGHKEFRFLPISKAKYRPFCGCGIKMERDFSAEHGRQAPSGTWPMSCESLAVHPVQIGEAVSDAAKKGVRTDFKKDGSPIFESPGHKKRYCEAYRVFDRNGGYSDPRKGLSR